MLALVNRSEEDYLNDSFNNYSSKKDNIEIEMRFSLLKGKRVIIEPAAV